MFRRAFALLALPFFTLAAQKSDLTITVATSNNSPIRLVQTPVDSTEPVVVANGHMTVHYFAPVKPKSFTVIAEDSTSSVSVLVSEHNHTIASGSGAYVTIQTDTGRFVMLESGPRALLQRRMSEGRSPGDDTGKLVLGKDLSTGESWLTTEFTYKLPRKPDSSAGYAGGSFCRMCVTAPMIPSPSRIMQIIKM